MDTNDEPADQLRNQAAGKPADFDRGAARRAAAIEDAVRKFGYARGERFSGLTWLDVDATGPQRNAVKGQLMGYFQPAKVARVEDLRNVLLFGGPGTGKDYRLSVLALEAIRRGLNVRWTNGTELVASFRDAIKEDRETLTAREYQTADVFYLSDPVLGEPLTPYQTQCLYRIVDRRWNQKRPTWVSLNAESAADAIRMIGEAAFDRLCDGAIVCYCPWESYRTAHQVLNKRSG